VYLSDLYFNGSNKANGVYVSVANLSAGSSFQFTQTQTYSVAVNLDPATTVSEDKEWIAVWTTAIIQRPAVIFMFRGLVSWATWT